MISVIVPTHNREKTIKKSIDSVLCQTYNNIEIIVVDDKSTDNTEEVINSIKDNRIKYIKLDENKGACFARNKGIELAQGKYIAFQDSDDEWLPQKLEIQLRYLEEKKLDVVSCRMYQIFDESKTKIFPAKCKINKQELYFKNCISTQTILGKAECFKNEKFDVNLPRFQDWDLVLRIVKKYRVEIVEQILVKAYIQENSISKNPEKAIKAMEIFLKKHCINRKVKGYYLRLIALYRMQAKLDYKHLFLRAFINNPFNKEIIFDFIISRIGMDKFHYNFYVNRGRFR